ncbi:HAD family hydrolase [Bacillus sp. H-16]|uniref:HAD family hydrolase n=1 Tax=Alteribacter salitolerans TaxID=2912333 RepID=UPI001962EDFF|nr:HAD family hydrolase [Alteribacter salitolerans]MBM7095084.1 HAD family hydrolase [Alteribacter salitolerans]
MPKIILFDLDGTLSDPKQGITKSVQYALAKMDIHEPDTDKLDDFIGPPLHVSFAGKYAFDDAQTQRAIGFYRERFKEKGMFENELYPGIRALLTSLQNNGFSLVTATSKPTVFAEAILAYFEIDQYFDPIVGSHLDGTRSSKAEIITFIMETYTDHTRDDFIMIGDRKYDIIGANTAGIESFAVTYGYGSEKELRDASPSLIVHTVEELKQTLEADLPAKADTRVLGEK